jgi:RNA polymerase II subunit A-like phosphatase
MKSEVLQGCNIVFSGVIPLDKAPETCVFYYLISACCLSLFYIRSEVWQLAEQFGATCSHDLSRRTTHVIAARKGTSKVNSAQRRREISIVSLSWLLTSVNLWRRQPESAYTLDPGSPQGSDVVSSRNDDGPSSQNISGNLDEGEDDEEADLQDINWGDAEAEIQAFLDETDDEDSRLDSSHEDGTDGQPSEDESYSVATEGKKRPLSSSTASRSGTEVGASSPLAKRRRVAAARAGQSKLKLSESALAVEDAADSTADEGEDEDLDDFAKALEGELM